MTREPGLFESLERCPACSGSPVEFFRKGTFNPGDLSEEQIKITDSQYGKIWDLSRCPACGHVFANPCPSLSYLQSLYMRVEDPLYEEEAPGRARNFLKILDRLEGLLPSKGRLLDVGAATGILVRLARRRGWEAEGVESSRWAVRLAREKYGLSLHPGNFESINLPSLSYSAVTMVDFIEHTPRPFDACLKAFEILAPRGVLCLVTPDRGSLAARLAGRKWWHFRPGHLAYFSPGSLAALLGRAGFRIVKEKRYSWTFSAHYLLSRKKGFEILLKNSSLSSFLKRIPIKLVLGDSLEVYARKETL